MQGIFRWMPIRAALQAGLITLVAAIPGTTTLWAHPASGSLAPPLDSLKLLQAPLGARANWAALKDKVVVLEFWATWCSPCIASLPHLNRMEASLDPAKFQFISIDDENLKAVQGFLTKKKMSGWVGIDQSGKIFAEYGVNVRPTTVIVDGNGKIVAVTEIGSVSAADLRAVAEGKNVAFKPLMDITESNGESAKDKATQPLFEVSVSKASANANPAQVNHPPTGTDFLGVDADSLMTDVFNPFENRYVLKDPLPAGRYNLRTNFVGVSPSVSTSMVQQAVLSALHLQVRTRTVRKRVYILRSTSASAKLLSFSASTRKAKRGYWDGIFVLVNGTMDDLAYVLATGLENPVINETGIKGSFDARFKVAGKGVDSLNAALMKTLGLELVPGIQESSISVLEVSPLLGSKPSSSAIARPNKH
ncbi:MAG TPA: redoxin family protein [Terracidiphilus sp.]|nr:redoxin family protein [Terracidiphilus sp.]